MKPEVRVMLAYVASRMISGAESSFVFDNSGLGHRSMGGTVDETRVNVYDYTGNCHMTGNGGGGSLNLYHHGEGIHLSLHISGESFNGYDHGEGRGFQGFVRGPHITLVDLADNLRLSFWCEAPRTTRLPDVEIEGTDRESDSQALESEPESPAGE